MKNCYFLLPILFLILGGCVSREIPPPVVPYLFYTVPPPHTSGRTDEPVNLRCIDNSNIYVFCNEGWWYAGPQKGWIPTGGGWYPWPRQIWPEYVFDIIPPWRLKNGTPPVLNYPY